MQLDSVRELKAAVKKSVVGSLMQPKAMARALALPAGPIDTTHRTLALGIARKGPDNYQLAVRLQRPELQNSPELDAIRRQSKGEVDIRYIGRLSKFADAGLPWYRKRARPLRIGVSIGDYKVTAGTLGCFVTSRADGAALILSNNHVLANENDAKAGDAILQPGTYDDGKRPADVVGKLANFVKLKAVGSNLVDCAVASIKKTIRQNAGEVGSFGKLAGLGPVF